MIPHANLLERLAALNQVEAVREFAVHDKPEIRT